MSYSFPYFLCYKHNLQKRGVLSDWLKKKRFKKRYLKRLPVKRAVSVAEVIGEMEFSIEDAKNNPDPEKQAEFKKLFGDRTPTPEEFIYKVTKKLHQ